MTQATTAKTASAFALSPDDDLNDLRMSQKVIPLYEHVKRFIKETVDPMSVKYKALGEGRAGTMRPANSTCSTAPRNRPKKKGFGISSCPMPTPARACPTSTTPTLPLNWAKTRWHRNA